MKLKFLILALIIVAIIIGGYFYFFRPLQYTTPLKTTPARALPSLNVYGNLIDYSQNELTIFKIQSEIVDWELNNTYLEIEADPQKNFDQTIELLRCLGFEDKGLGLYEYGIYNYSSLEDFLTANNVNNEEKKACEIKILENLKKEYSECKEIIILDGTEKDYNKWEFNLACKLKINLIKGNNYVFYFAKTLDEKEPWDRVTISENLTEYKQNGAWKHERDLTIDPLITTKGGEGELEPQQVRAVQIIPTSITTGQRTELKILLINRQDNDIRYKITDASIVDNLVYFPFLNQFEEKHMNQPPIDVRLNNAIVKNCNVQYDSSEQVIKSNSNKTLSFFITCNEPIIKERTYLSCDIDGENCSNITTKTEFLLFGKVSFDDELGNSHIFPQKGILKQFLEIK